MDPRVKGDNERAKRIPEKFRCRRCQGTGNELMFMYKRCEACNGSGIVKNKEDHIKELERQLDVAKKALQAAHILTVELEAIAESPEFQQVFVLSAAHGYEYNGSTWTKTKLDLDGRFSKTRLR